MLARGLAEFIGVHEKNRHQEIVRLLRRDSVWRQHVRRKVSQVVCKDNTASALNRGSRHMPILCVDTFQIVDAGLIPRNKSIAKELIHQRQRVPFKLRMI